MSMNSCDVGTGAISFHVVFILSPVSGMNEQRLTLGRYSLYSQLSILQSTNFWWSRSYQHVTIVLALLIAKFKNGAASCPTVTLPPTNNASRIRSPNNTVTQDH